MWWMLLIMVRMEWVFVRFSLYLRMNRFDDISRSAPFGMPYTDENGADRYKFGGKEYDAVGSLNLYDFEARMYDPALARFMSPDPLADRYPSVSPYAYCANNPIRNIDPTGMSIISELMGREVKLEKLKNGSYKFQHSGIPSFDGMFIEAAINAIASTTTGEQMIDRCINSSEIVNIQLYKNVAKEDKDANHNRFQELSDGSFRIIWDITQTTGGIHDDVDGVTRERPSFIGLAHELAHADDFFSGITNNEVYMKSPYVTKSELYACYVENILRLHYNIPLRTHYVRLKRADGSFKGYEPTRIARGSSFINFNVYKKYDTFFKF
ncbi:MAG: hypothetical protein K2M65_04860 [Muribaculaceae bacterium]|nr:hypothetical protein [Muribaculaceae bacterium]